MDFINSRSLYLLILVPLVLILYILKLKRKIYIVPSCLLWEQSIEDMKANTFLQRFRRNILIPLQIIFLVMIIFAVARPFIRGVSKNLRNIILIIDNSASMKATDVDKSRFQNAKQIANKIISELKNNENIAIIQTSYPSKILTSLTQDKYLLRKIIDQMIAEDTSSDIIGSIRLAESLSFDTKNTEIIIMSDGANELKDYNEDIKVPVRFIGLGTGNANNVGIIAIDLATDLPYSSRKNVQLLVTLKNFNKIKSQLAVLELYFNNKLFDIRELRLTPGEQRSVIFNNINYEEGIIEVVNNINDDFDVDDHAYIILSKSKSIQILLVSKGNMFLEQAIKTSSHKVDIYKGYPELHDRSENFDLIIYDGFVPNSLPSKDILFINPDSDLPFGRIISKKKNPKIIDWDGANSIMRFVDLEGLQIDEIKEFDMPGWMKPLAESNKGVALWYGENNNQRILVVPFDIKPGIYNNFAMLSAFPIFISNSLDWLTRSKINKQLKPGETFIMNVDNKSNMSITVKKPDKKEIKVDTKNGLLIFNDTKEVGIYEVISNYINEKFAVNLLDEKESDIQPISKINISGQEITSSTYSTITNKEIWTIIIFIATFLLAIEWWVYHRRVLV
ncbi:MAG: vWA domain-containing protein [bacterium]